MRNVKYPIFILILGLTFRCMNVFALDDYLEVKGNIKANTVTWSANSTTQNFPLTPLEGEVFYNNQTGAKQPYYFDGAGWNAFASGQKKVATIIVAASNSRGTTGCPANCKNPRTDDIYVCDGTKDEQQINRAINKLPASGGVVYLLEGTYNIDVSVLEGETFLGIIPHTRTTLMGAGEGTVLKNTGVGGGGFPIISVWYNRINISRLLIDGNNKPGGGILINGGILIDNFGNNTVDSVTIRNFLGMGPDTSGRGIEICNLANNNIITNNVIQSNANSGIFITSSANNLVSGNILRSNGTGISLSITANFNIIRDNNIQSSTTYGISLDSNYNNLIVANNIQSNPYGIFMLNSIYAIGNYLILDNNITLSSQAGICSMAPGFYGSTISGNNITSSGTYGIDLSAGASNTLISENNVYGVTLDGIRLTGNENVVSSNIVYSSSGSRYGVNINATESNYLIGNLISGSGFSQPINDSGATTKYTDKTKITLDAGSYTIPANVLTPAGSTSYLRLTGGPLTINSITAGKGGDLLILENTTSNNVTVNANIGNIKLEIASLVLGLNDVLTLIWDGSAWVEIGYANN